MSTQILTELPNIQKAGMDYQTVLNEIRNIIIDNPNWKENWSEFYDSEAGVMLAQLMAWVADNMSTRQDLLYNEMFINTARKDEDKVKHLQHIGYVPQFPHAAKARVKISFNKLTKENIVVIPETNSNSDLSNRVSQIASFEGKDINGQIATWEIINMINNKPDYLGSVILSKGDTEYRTDAKGNTLFAVQGKTHYEEFFTDTEDGSVFNLREKNIAADSLVIYNKKKFNEKKGGELKRVDSFISQEAMDPNSTYPYVLELNEDLTYNIRFSQKGILPNDKLLPAGTTIGVFYRTCNGNLGNIKTNILNKETNYKDTKGENYKATILNEFPGLGGSNKETLDQAVLNGPVSLRTMDRAVTPEDYNIILNRNTNIFKAKTYTASNRPNDFKKYYGRYINPQESFSFVMLNKNYKDVPTSKYNFFPWVTTIKEPRMNEKYIFDDADFNVNVRKSKTLYNVKTKEDEKKPKFFRNATILDLGEKFNKAFKDAKLLSTKEGSDFLEAKITIDKRDDMYFKNMPFNIFADNSGYSLSLKNDFISMDDNARFVQVKYQDMSKPIDIATYNELNFILNDEIPVNVNLKEEVDPSLTNAFIYWDNVPTKTPEGIEKNDTSEGAKYRNGVVQLINKTINTLVSENGNFKPLNNTSKQYLGLKNISDTSEPILNNTFRFSLSINEKDYFFEANKDRKDITGVFGSLDYIKNFLNNCFINGHCHAAVGETPEIPIKKYLNGGTIGDIDEGDKTFLKNFSSGITNSRMLFNSDFSDENVDSENYKLVSDLYIGSSTNLMTVKFVDQDGIEHTFENVVSVKDPSNSGEYTGLFSLLKISKIDIPYPYQAVDYKDVAYIDYKDEEKKEGRLVIKSPSKGLSSSIYFRRDGKVNDFSENYLGIYFINSPFYSYKAYGEKKAYLINKDLLSITADGKIINDVSGYSGNVIFENSCIYNDADFNNLYASYKLKENKVLKLGSVYENFYSSGDESDEELKKSNPVVGLEGQYIIANKDANGNIIYDIDENKSRFNIKFTKEIENTNSLSAIKNELGVVASNYTEVKTYDLSRLSDLSLDANLSFTIDNDANKIIVNTNGIKNAKELIRSIKESVNKNIDVSYNYLKENIDSIVSIDMKSINQIIIRGLSKNNGKITFYKEDGDIDSYKRLFKALLGTNNTNSEFYALYPKDIMDEKNIFYIDATKGTENEEYFYCPNTDKDLVFYYRALLKMNDGTLYSKSPDYYISLEKDGDTPVGAKMPKYSFYLNKTENSDFPDNYFYVHFVNDKTYNFDNGGKIKETDESILQNYMRKYKISGTDIIFLQPYFRTYDIAANIKYNTNFSEAEVSKDVKDALNNLCSLKNAEIAGSMSRAKIFKTIMNCKGVEDCRISYFGYDYESLKGDSEVLESDFYEIMCLHEDDNVNNNHGKILNFEPYTDRTFDA